MKKTFKVVMLPTKEQANIFLEENITLTYYKYQQKHSLKGIAMNLYIISDDKIKEGDWYLNFETDYATEPKERWVLYNCVTKPNGINPKKIVATTDTSLHTTECVDGSELMDEWQGEKIDLHTELPQLPESFIKAYIKAYNEDKPITEVDLEIINCERHEECNGDFNNKCTQTVIKTRPDNTVIVHQSKMYTRAQVIKFIEKHTEDMFKQKLTLDEWINENL